MKQTPEEKKLAENLQPGSLSAKGFMGDDSRDTASIIAADKVTVERLGLTHQDIATRLRSLTEKGSSGLRAPVVVEDLEITVDDFRGRLVCPFKDRTFHRKRLTTCRNRKTGRSLRWTDLNIHMIEAHGFYEGLGSAYRVEPQDVLEICLNV